MKRTMKRGISPLVSWVLLVGFVVALAVMVTTWVRDQAETTTDKAVEGIEGDIRCSQVALNVNIDCTTDPTLGTMTLTNKGKFTIHEIRVRQPGQSINRIIDLLPRQGGREDLNIPADLDPLVEADIIPSILLEGKKVICSERKVVISC